MYLYTKCLIFVYKMSFEGSITPPESDDDDCNNTYDAVKSPVLKQRFSARSLGLTIKPKEKDLNEQFYACSVDLMVKRKHLNESQFSKNSNLQNFKGILESMQNILLNSDPQPDCIFNALKLLFALSNEISFTIGEEVNCMVSRIPFDIQCKSFEEWLNCFVDISLVLLDILAYAIKHKCITQTFKIYHSDGTIVDGEANCLNKTVERILYDILSICASIFQAFNSVNKLNCKIPACSAFQKLLLKCCTLLRCEEDFWTSIISLINSIIPSGKRRFQFDATSSALSFCWWWIKILPLNSNISSCFTLVNSLLRRSLAASSKQSNIISFHILCYEKVMMTFFNSMSTRQLKSAELAGFHLLWQNISQHYFVGNKVTGVKKDLIVTSVLQWLSQLPNRFQSYEKDNVSTESFMAFLAVLKTFLSRDNGSVWLLLKDRFLQRLQLPVMKQMTAMGLDCYFSVVLTVLHSCPKNNADATLKVFMSLLGSLNFESSAVAKLQVYINGLFAVMHVCYKRDLSYQLPATKAGQCFERFSGLLSTTGVLKQTDQLLRCIESFFTCVSDLMNLDNLIDLNMLIPLHWVRGVVDKLNSNEANTVIHFVHKLIEYAKDSVQPNVHLFCQCFVKESVACLQKCSFNDQEIIGELTFFLALKPDSTDMSLFCQIWKYFSSEGQVDILFRCCYLRNCLQNTAVFNFVNNHETNATKHNETLVVDCAVQGWVQCVALLSDVQPAMIKDVTRAIAQLKVIEKLGKFESADFSIEVFLKLLASKHKSACNFLERIHWTNQAKCWIGTTLDKSIPDLSNENYFNSIYSTFATVIENCSLLLHTGKASFVTRSLNVFILNSEKCNERNDNAISKYLDKFMAGCLTIGTKDIYINQILKQIINVYLMKWPTPSEHPFLRLLHNLEPNLLLIMLELLRQFLTSDFHTNKLVMTVEILYEWSRSSTVNPHSFPDFKSALMSVRPQLRFSSGLLEKLDFLLTFFGY